MKYNFENFYGDKIFWWKFKKIWQKYAFLSNFCFKHDTDYNKSYTILHNFKFYTILNKNELWNTKLYKLRGLGYALVIWIDRGEVGNANDICIEEYNYE